MWLSVPMTRQSTRRNQFEAVPPEEKQSVGFFASGTATAPARNDASSARQFLLCEAIQQLQTQQKVMIIGILIYFCNQIRVGFRI